MFDLSILTPYLCLLCDQGITQKVSWKNLLMKEQERSICAECFRKLDPISGELCQICSRVLSAEFRRDTLCLDCHRWEQNPNWQGFLTANRSLFHYNDFMKEQIAKFKYRGDYAIAEAFSPFIKDALLPLTFDSIVVIPLSHERLQERGFNQAEALAVTAGQACIQPLTRIHSEKQSKKSRRDRINLPQVFQITDPEIMSGQRILLLDDIYTTGSTLRHAAKALKLAGAADIHSLTLAR
ncbi:ComF family protein [Peribacillus loiseleuriae]|uniref:Phosphoribosyltransferase n=1 Tax=Peribacillus loiseleuriae TaxID=1679170 RepID=A0A0K9GYP7_9BACI|nr:ComF family protein [Peribacillus loiseleuriae]KMY51854.1 phosphoribosyltransferase [Peribacillus loiseleuriae]